VGQGELKHITTAAYYSRKKIGSVHAGKKYSEPSIAVGCVSADSTN
jgi:hypothetical protein